MVWLVTHIWIGLALAAISGLLFGWAFRGIKLKARARHAMVARDIALTELEQSRAEIDQLYAAQNKGANVAAQAGDMALQNELEAREIKLKVLSKELAASQEALEDLKAKALVGTVGAGIGAVGVAVAALGDGEEKAEQAHAERLDAGLNLSDASLEWRNRYLQSRVRALEAEAHVDASPADEVEIVVMDAADMPVLEEHAVNLEKQAWQNAYLRQRLEAAQNAVPATEITEPEDLDITALAPDVEGIDDEIDETGDVNADKQAWQNNYLRQRIAYMETHAPKDRPALAALVEDVEKTDGSPAQDEDMPLTDIALGVGALGAGALSIVGAEPSGAETIDTSMQVRQTDFGDQTDLGDQADPGEMEQELARLRWRNRYLEGRLAYIEGDREAAETQVDAEINDSVQLEATQAGIEADKAYADDYEPIKPAGPTFSIDDFEEEEEGDAGEDYGPTPAEAVLAAMEGRSLTPEEPEALPEPEDGGDDLTRINGVGKSTASALNRLGIWHFHQIAGWTPENVSWINQHFDAVRRVQDDEWVAQAGALSLGVVFDASA